MKLLWQVSLCCLLTGGVAMAQRGGGGMHGGGGGNFGGFGGGVPGSGNGIGRVGTGRGMFIGVSLSTGPGIPATAVGLPFTNVSFPFGLGFTATPLGFSNNGFANIAAFRNFDNRSFFGQGPNSPFWGGMGGWGFGISDMGLPFAGSSYWPGLGYASYPASVNAAVYPQRVVQPLSAERARPVIHEYDQSGQEIRSAAPSPLAANQPPEQFVAARSGERGRPVIHEYDQSGREIGSAGSPLFLIAFADHTIHPAIAYRVDGNTLDYATPEREQKQV